MRSPKFTDKLDEALVSPPKDEEACFSPDEPCDIKLLKFIDSANSSLDIAIYDINLDELVHHFLVKALKIPVRIVVDRRQAKGGHSLVPTLLQGGAQLRYGRQRGIMHNKFVIVDGKRVEVGSFNYTHHAGAPIRKTRSISRLPRSWSGTASVTKKSGPGRTQSLKDH